MDSVVNFTRPSEKSKTSVSENIPENRKGTLTSSFHEACMTEISKAGKYLRKREMLEQFP